ncbi:MAG: 4-hydroxythreonine-4-phosphate dehydrogenase PdxA [Bacteroidetes bacterium]|nr:4-hydroxythreonine-4-phosphate dehydrogenase PdxA [Bacteroidota bacterium]
MTTDKPTIGITLGDPNGIGPEVVIKALADNRIFNLFTPVVYGSTRVISFYKKQLNAEEFNYSQTKPDTSFFPKSVNVVNCWEEPVEITPGTASRAAGKCALLSLKKAISDLKAGTIQALVTAPIDKNTIHNDEFPYHGHTEYLTQEFNAGESLMLLTGNELKVGLVTEHVPVKEIARHITRDRIELKIRLFEMSLKQDFGIQKPKIAVLGLNPHAGDGGLLGSEENEIIKPVITDLKTKGKLIFGPFPADGFFGSGQHTKFDGVLAMYHDQGLVAFKTLDFSNGVNYTAGLPIVRTSPDHGTAYAIAGKNQADENSMRQAIYLACDIAKQRQPAKQTT